MVKEAKGKFPHLLFIHFKKINSFDNFVFEFTLEKQFKFILRIISLYMYIHIHI